jgi:DNA repair exonuclease SbcCD ATPase subunit
LVVLLLHLVSAPQLIFCGPIWRQKALASPATKLLRPAPEQATPLERLHADRAGLTSELAGLNASSARLRETANAEAAVLQEIGAMGSAEIAAMTAWASAGCVGDAPAPDLKQRRALAEKLATAQSAAAAAKGAGADIDHQIGELNDRLRNIAAQIEKAALDAMQADFSTLNDQHLAATEAVRKVAAKMHGLCSYLTNEGRRLIDRGDHEAGKRYLARAEAFTGIKLASPGVTQGEIIEAANDWSRRAAALRSGSPS